MDAEGWISRVDDLFYRCVDEIFFYRLKIFNDYWIKYS